MDRARADTGAVAETQVRYEGGAFAGGVSGQAEGGSIEGIYFTPPAELLRSCE